MKIATTLYSTVHCSPLTHACQKAASCLPSWDLLKMYEFPPQPRARSWSFPVAKLRQQLPALRRSRSTPQQLLVGEEHRDYLILLSEDSLDVLADDVAESPKDFLYQLIDHEQGARELVTSGTSQFAYSEKNRCLPSDPQSQTSSNSHIRSCRRSVSAK
jgi:hypothetical protein